MRIFLAGATGAIGTQLVPLLVRGGHQVTATTRRSTNVDSLRAARTDPVVLDALDKDAVVRAVVVARPDVVVHQMTALASMGNLKKFDGELAQTNRLRTEATDYLLAGARAAGARRFVAQSYAGWPNIREGGRVKTEDDPLDPDPPASMRRTLDAIRGLEAAVTGAPGMAGIVLRYGSFYGPGTAISPGGQILEAVRRRVFPIVGGGAGVWSFIHVEDAARATLLAVESSARGIYNIVDDEPAEVSVWLPYLAHVVGAGPPRRLPAWIGRLAIGDAGISMMTKMRGSSNAKAKRELEWRLMHPTWRDGFASLGAA